MQGVSGHWNGEVFVGDARADFERFRRRGLGRAHEDRGDCLDNVPGDEAHAYVVNEASEAHVRVPLTPKTRSHAFDWLGNIKTSSDDPLGFYDRSLGEAATRTAEQVAEIVTEVARSGNTQHPPGRGRGQLPHRTILQPSPRIPHSYCAKR